MTDHIIAASKSVGVGVFSIEMGIQQVVDRMIHNIAGLNYHRCQSNITKDDKDRLEEAMSTLSGYKDIFFTESASCMYPEWMFKKGSPEDSIEIEFQQMIDAGAKIFFLDYLQLVRWGYSSEREDLRIKNITNKFHEMSLKYSVPIVLLSQLTKTTADRATRKEDPTPTLSDLRDSGYIINDADVIILIHRPEYYKKKKESLELLDDLTEEAEIIIAKQRNGPTGCIHVPFHSYCMSFRENSNSDSLF